MTNNDGNTDIITNMEEAVRQGRISKDDYLITKLTRDTAQTTEPSQSIIEKAARNT